MITKLFVAVREYFDKGRRYRAVVAEIASLNQRDLQELRADPSEMRRVAYDNIYGRASA